MAKETEIEFKNLLSAEEYFLLLKKFNISKKDIKEQTNIYFDTPDGKLRNKKCGLRIRLLIDKVEFTLKVPGKDNYTYLEITDYLDTYSPDLSLETQLSSTSNDVLTYLKKEKFPVSDLEKIGSLTTLRAELKLTPSVLLVLDESHYGQITDYELEMEVLDTQEGSDFFKQFLKEHHIPSRPAKKKVARMFEEKIKSQA